MIATLIWAGSCIMHALCLGLAPACYEDSKGDELGEWIQAPGS